MDKQIETTKNFFDNISSNYKAKYKTKNAFHYYFFIQRLIKSTEGFDFKNKTMLDIGSGTGDLYDFIYKDNKEINYYATDISSGMLSESNVPNENKYVGHCYDINFPVKKFDYVFLLGVTTYMEPVELNKSIDFIKSILKDDGTLIMTFTNSSSIDSIIRSITKPIYKLFANKKNVLAQDFVIQMYNTANAKNLFNGKMNVERVSFLNQTIFPFNLLMKKLSVWFADKLEKLLKNSSLLNYFSSDFILFVKK